MENKKVALIFLYFIGAIQLVAGVYTQLVGLFHWDFMSLFPVVEMGTQQILYLNLLAVFLVTTLIHIVVAALVNDGSYGPLDVLQACPPLVHPGPALSGLGRQKAARAAAFCFLPNHAHQCVRRNFPSS